MFRKILLAGVFVLAFAAAAFAETPVGISINFYDDDGGIEPLTEFPAGIKWMKRIRFGNRKLKGFAYPIRIDLEQAREIDQAFKIRGSGRLLVSVNCGSMLDGRRDNILKIRCVKLVLNGVPAKRAPFVFTQWTAADQIQVKDGDVLTIEAEFEKVE